MPLNESSAGGQGLIGMRHRVVSCGGRLDWRAVGEGGHEVRAQFPVPVPP